MQATNTLIPGCYYHIYNRGNNRENLFLERRNYVYFLELYTKHLAQTVDTYAYCLMPNHFHLLIRIKPNPDDDCLKPLQKLAVNFVFGTFFGTYTKAINKAYKRTGRLFSESFRYKEVNTDRYFSTLMFYIHFNPQKHGFVNDFRDWEWSSYATYLSATPTNLAREDGLSWFNGQIGFETFHKNVVDENAIAPLVVDDFI